MIAPENRAYENPNSDLIRSLGDSESSDWEAFHKSQEPYRRDFMEMEKQWRMIYNDSKATFDARRKAGRNLFYSDLRIDIHEVIGRIFRGFNDSVPTNSETANKPSDDARLFPVRD